MNDSTPSLYHLTRPSKAIIGKPPLLVLLHGIGSNEQDLFGLEPFLDERFLILSVRAPLPLEPGSYAWFHAEHGPVPIINDAEEESSRQLLLRFIDEAVRIYKADGNRVYLMGFSQGAVMSMSTMLTHPEVIAGVVAMSGRILPEIKALTVPPERLRGFPVLVTHGLYDEVLPIVHGRASRDYLSKLSVDLIYREYPIAHEVSDESLEDIRRWLTGELNSKHARFVSTVEQGR